MLFEQYEMDWSQWLVQDVGYKNVLAVVLGGAISYLAGIILHRAHKADYMTNKTLLSFSVGLGL